MSEPPYACELFVDFFCFEIIRIKVASDPVEHLVMLWMKRIGDRFQKLLITSDAATVLRWASSSATEAGRQLTGRSVIEHLLEHDFMLPPVAEIVFLE